MSAVLSNWFYLAGWRDIVAQTWGENICWVYLFIYYNNRLCYTTRKRSFFNGPGVHSALAFTSLALATVDWDQHIEHD